MVIARLLLLATLALAGIWSVAEPLLLSQVRPRVQADRVGPQPAWGRLGLALSGVTLPMQAGQLNLPALDLWVTPTAPLTVRADLPAAAFLDGPAGRRQVGMEDAAAAVTLSPLGRVRQADASFAALSLDGGPLSGRGSVTALAVADDRIAGHPYQVQIAFPDLRLPQVSSAQGGLRLWLDRQPGVATEAPPAVLGVLTEGLEIGTGASSLRVVGMLGKGSDGRAQGRVALYTSDAAAMLDAAIEAGLMSSNARLLARAMLNRIGGMEFAEGGAGQPAMPPAPEGQLRIPVEMRDGRMYLGTLEIGPAPRWPAF
ncbi:DUF2125 domain-containing protein [Paracoccus benzoatiresistens]|uniref:DUF2125 domain-containing protein n=1 Tax=Paracoccus benzoatiresistens TaxID=2997341 RepID=A0ABT4J839_9RHOB|nr:DUF2125 domain-containing protein [Paracoccus sp. EF6]MCZ0962591.1 DUF2125 domain-containing protein [Paracoccus sp. EF6]